MQELSGGTPSANLLTGGVDEIFSRTDTTLGTRHFVTDALGSTLALTDNSGAVQVSYTYDPYGATTASGEANGNAAQYTGRENDGTGLYYYRARYYHAGFMRFASSDPIGFAGGINTYAYVRGNPLSKTDPLGLFDTGSGDHYYRIWVPLCMFCSTTDAFNAMRNFSAPGAPYAVDGTHDLVLAGGNPIRQTVDSCNKTITNRTLPGHVFGGQVVITITENNGAVGAQVVGSGYGPNAELNQMLGPVIFTGLGFGAYQTMNPQPAF